MNNCQKILWLLKFAALRACSGRRLKAGGRNYFARGSLQIKDGSLALGQLNVFTDGFDIEVKGALSIGTKNYFNKNVKIVCLEKITIGDNNIIADSVHFYDHDHNFADAGRPVREQGYVTRPITVGDNVWIGAKATILKGVTIGHGAIIGASAVVTKDVPANAIVVGNPGRILKIRGSNG